MSITYSVRHAAASSLDVGMLAVLCPKGAAAPDALTALDSLLGGAIGRAWARGSFTGKRDDVLHLSGGATGPERVILVGMGDAADFSLALKRAAQLAGRRANAATVRSIAVLVPAGLDVRGVEQVIVGASMGAWEYRELKTPPTEPRTPLESIAVLVDDEAAAADGNALQRRTDWPAVRPSPPGTPWHAASR
jgi:leucyl aminopeptidase